MLIKQGLEKQIASAIYDAMKSAMTEMNKAMKNAVNASGDGSDYSMNNAIEVFANKAQACAGEIATAIDEYIKSATITINAGTLMVPLPGLMSPSGPVSGAIVLAVPTSMQNSIS